MAIPSKWAGPPVEWAGLPVSPTLPYLRVSKVCLMLPGVWDARWDDGTFPSGVRWPGRGAGDVWHAGGANL